MENKLPQRHSPRLKNYNYSHPGSYFVTVCAHEKRPLFSEIVPPSCHGSEGRGSSSVTVKLTEVGKVVEEAILAVKPVYSNVTIPYYVIMPDHIHLIIDIVSGQSEKDQSVSDIVRYIKILVTHKAKGMTGLDKIFHRSFFDRVIRSEAEYEDTRDYILNNPATRYFKEHPRKPISCDE